MMKKNDIINIFQDGKICRGVRATVLALRSQSVQVKFADCNGEEVIVWCRQRDRKGVYEAIGWNYFILVPFDPWKGEDSSSRPVPI